MTALKSGDVAPEFTLDSPNGLISLKEMKGKKIVLYFYPKDNTPGCTVEAIDFTGAKKEFDKLNTIILGVSKDSIKSHDKFCSGKGLTITLLSDPDAAVQKAYGVWGKKKFMGLESVGTLRTTFLIDKKQRIAKVWENVKVNGHAKEVLEAVKKHFKS